jgi:outer membrane murein-binding lipoprotein Lpp
MIRLRSVLFAALFGPAFLALAGCWSNNSTSSGTISAPEEQTYAITIYDIDKKQRIQYITDHVAAYVNHARQLPGSTEFLQRILLGSVFDDLSDVLPKIAGADPGAVFRQQFHIIQSTHAQLNALTLDASSDAIVEAGLRAASDALEDFSTKSFADQTDLATDINDLNSKIDELDTAPPETHRQIEADAAVRIGAIMQQMSGLLIQRLQPATAPSTQMSIKPATMPS